MTLNDIDVITAGIEAFITRIPLSSNPYADYHRRDLWRQGWCREFYCHYFSKQVELP
jgi:hypothetical protein